MPNDRLSFSTSQNKEENKVERGSVTELRTQRTQFREDEGDRMFRAEYQREGS